MVTNSRGDVVAILNDDGDVVARYTYDAWGNILSITDYYGEEVDDVEHIGNLNSLRYRGYYYDDDIGMYYLQSRYYDPEVRRFINADDVSVLEEDQGSIVENNLFAYCANNPIKNEDSEGKALSNIIGAAVGGLAGAALGCVLAKKLKLKGWKKVALISAATVGGAVLGAFLGPYVAKLGRKIGSAVKKTLKLAKKSGKRASQSCINKGACFVAGTKISINNGFRNIEDIKVGDYVWAENPETGEKELKRVADTFIRQTKELVNIHVDGERIITTPEHPFYVPQKGWVKSINLRAGEIVVLRSGKYVAIEKIQHEILEKPITVYNFEVEDFHTYYVSNSEVLVHNKYIKDAKEFIKGSKNAKQVIEYLKKQGFKRVGQEGSHIKFVKGGRTVIVPNHGSKDIAKGTLRSIMKQAGLL